MESKMTYSFRLQSKYVLSFGVLSPRKNLELLIQAMAEVSEDAPDWHLVIAGGEPAYYKGYRTKLENVARNADIADHVKFTGYVDWEEAVELYSNAEIFAHTPKYRIAASGPVTTAISHNLSILVSDIPVFQEIFSHGKDGYLVDPDIPHISEGLSHLVEDPGLRKTLQEGTYELADRYSWGKIAQKTLEEYTSLVDMR